MRKLAILTVMAMFVVVVAGCQLSPYARKVSSLVTGINGSFLILEGNEATFSDYESIILVKPTTVIGPYCDEGMALLIDDLDEQLTDTELFKAVDSPSECTSGKEIAKGTLVIEGELLDYEKGNRFRRITTFDGKGFIIMRYTIKDGNSGEVLAVVNCRGFVEDSLKAGGNVTDAVNPVNGGLVKYLTERISREEE